MNLREANELFRRAIIKAYFEPQLLKMDYRKSPAKHPNIPEDGLTLDNVLHVYFDVVTGNDYPDGDEWLSSLDRFGIVSERGVLLEGSTVMQNLALPFTLEIDPIPESTLRQVTTLAVECGIAAEWLDRQTGQAPPAVRARIHLARALALDPQLLVLEHPTAAIPEAERAAFGALVARVCEARRLTALAITFDSAFAAAAAHRTLTLQPATGELVSARRRWWR